MIEPKMAVWRGRRRRIAVGALVVAVAVVAVAAILVIQAAVTGVEVVDIDVSLAALRAAVHNLTGHNLTQLLVVYGYWVVLLTVAVESAGVPVPGETMLLVASVYAGTTHRLSLPLVIAAAAAGAVLGDNLGYLAGREGGYRLLRRYGPAVGLNERKLKLGRYLFWKHGGKVVFFGRFVAVLRMWAAFLAGANRMRWTRFLLYNAAGGIIWAALYGVGGFVFGNSIHRLGGPVGAVTLALGVAGMVVGGVFLRRNERRLEDEAERALPGPLEAGEPR